MRIPFDCIHSNFARNISYSVTANVISFLVGVTVILLVPKAIGVVEYGYFQLFLFFIGYVGFFHFGWADGIILRYAGAQWEGLNRARFAGQIHFFLFFEVALWGFFALASFHYFSEGSKLFVLICTAVGAVLVLFNTFLRFILQATNRIKVYAFLLLVERVIYLASVLIVLVSGARDFRFFIAAYLIAQVSTAACAVWFTRDLVFRAGENLRDIFAESFICVRVGSKLLIANLASLLILGVIRFGIERVWGIATFGKISLLLSTVSILFVFVNAASIALLPALRREEDERFRAIYFPTRIVLSWFLLICFVFAYPASKIVAFWLPAYADALIYLPLILPVCLFESAVSLLTGTYLKALRRERDFLVGNCAALLVSLVFFSFAALYLKDLTITVLSMPVALAVRSFILESMLKARINVDARPILATEVLACIVLVTSARYIGGWESVFIYAAFLVIAFIVCRKTFWKNPLPFERFFSKLP